MARTWSIRANDGLVRTVKRPCRFLPKGRARFYILFENRVFRLDSLTRAGICVTAWGYWSDRPIPFGPWRREWSTPPMKKKSLKSGEQDAKHLAALESTVFSDLLPLIEHCAVTKYDDGDQRLPGWLTIKVQGAAWIVQVKDPDAAVSFQTVADTLDKALSTAALMLACDEAPWEPDPWLASKKKTGKK